MSRKRLQKVILFLVCVLLLQAFLPAAAFAEPEAAALEVTADDISVNVETVSAEEGSYLLRFVPQSPAVNDRIERIELEVCSEGKQPLTVQAAIGEQTGDYLAGITLEDALLYQIKTYVYVTGIEQPIVLDDIILDRTAEEEEQDSAEPSQEPSDPASSGQTGVPQTLQQNALQIMPKAGVALTAQAADASEKVYNVVLDGAQGPAG